MPDIATISAFLGSIKTATELAKAIKGVDSSLEKAELKLKIAELMESLADVKIQAVEIKELIQEKDVEIERLKTLLNAKSLPPTNDLPQECIEILKLLGSFVNGVPEEPLLEKAGISIQKGRYFLELLENRGLINSSYYEYDTDVVLYELSFKGRDFLFNNQQTLILINWSTAGKYSAFSPAKIKHRQ